jgi:hypothetical protein
MLRSSRAQAAQAFSRAGGGSELTGETTPAQPLDRTAAIPTMNPQEQRRND